MSKVWDDFQLHTSPKQDPRSRMMGHNDTTPANCAVVAGQMQAMPAPSRSKTKNEVKAKNSSMLHRWVEGNA